MLLDWHIVSNLLVKRRIRHKVNRDYKKIKFILTFIIDIEVVYTRILYKGLHLNDEFLTQEQYITVEQEVLPIISKGVSPPSYFTLLF